MSGREKSAEEERKTEGGGITGPVRGKKRPSFRETDSFLKRKEKNEWKDVERKVEEEEERRQKRKRAVGIPDKMTDRLGVCVCVYVCVSSIHRCDHRVRWDCRLTCALSVSAER